MSKNYLLHARPGTHAEMARGKRYNDIMTSIIVVNWNCGQYIPDCFASLGRQSFKDFEIIFVDNASTDRSLVLAKNLARELMLDVKFVEMDSNAGFAGGNNEGLKHCSGRYIALLNTDTIVHPDWLQALVYKIERHQEVGICASKLIVQGENVVDSAGDGYSTFGHAFKRGEGKAPEEFLSDEYTFGACAGAALYRREMLEKIGLFDEDFFLIFEDTDLNFRAQLSGWKCLFVPAAVYHKVGGSVKKMGGLSAYYSVRNDKLIKIKNLPLSIWLRKMPCFILGEILWFFYFLIQGKFRYYLRANLDAMKMLPLFLRKRKEVMKRKRVPDDYINGLFTSGFRLYGLQRIRRYLAL
jgi:GT2 family glycosyltransferase